eukprot:m.254372 g.254372  ORF g.254372 m.254372 type:complete len:156 (+) comp17984_c0_seq1:69-536(+)
MQSSLYLCALVLLGLCAQQAPANAVMETVEVDFDAKPNGQMSKAVANMMKPDGSGEMACIFEYAVVGGTNEEWHINIERTHDTYKCTIQRPDQASYLYFMTFSVQMEGLKSIESVEVRDPNGLLGSEQYTVDGFKVSAGDGFANALESVTIVASA